MRTERVSRGWQEMVLTYLQGVHLNIEERESQNQQAHHLTCLLKQSDYTSFLTWTNKLGTSVASVFCRSLDALTKLKENCPNIRSLQLSNVKWDPEQPCPHNLLDNFKSLEQVSFYFCPIQDACVNQLLTEKALQKLEFHQCLYLRGLFLKDLNLSNLKTLVIEECRSLKWPKRIVSVIDLLGELKELKLVNIVGYNSIIDADLNEVQLVLSKMPKLESLILHGGYMNEKSIEQLSQLARLKHLSVTYQMEYRHVEAVTRCCKELTSLELLDCKYLMGVEMFGRHAGARLKKLVLDDFSLAHDDFVVEIVRTCPALQSLFVGGAERLTCALPARAAAARTQAAPGRTLRLDLSYTNLSDEFNLQDRGIERHGQYEEMKTKYKDLIVILENTTDEYDDEDESDDEFEDNDFNDYDFDFDNSWYDDYEDEDEAEDDENEVHGDYD